MSTNNLSTADMNIEDYEDQAIKKSRLAKGIGIAAAGVVGGAAIGAGSAYAASNGMEEVLDEPLDADELIGGAEVGEDIEPITEAPAQPTTQYVSVESPKPTPEQNDTPEVTWNEATEYYVDGEKVMSVEEGTIDGHDFMIADLDGDNKADILAYDQNGNHIYEENEIIEVTPSDNIMMGNETAQTTVHHYDNPFGVADPVYPEEPAPYVAINEEPKIYNNFDDEKTGEEYHGDFAENNPDYNPNADLDYGEAGYSNQYLAENYDYDGYGSDNSRASLNGMDAEDNVSSQPDMADASGMEDDSFDSMMDSEEFLG